VKGDGVFTQGWSHARRIACASGGVAGGGGKLAALMLKTAADLEAEAEAMDQACRHRRCGGTGA
jgi:hypothetical protein